MSKLNLLHSDRLYLKELQADDVQENYLTWMNDVEVTRYLESRFQSYSLQDLKEYVNKLLLDPNHFMFGIFLKLNDRHIGNIKLGPVSWAHKNGEIGIMIGEKDCWGLGYANEAIQLITQHAFLNLNLRKLTAGCYQTNQGSAKAFEKAGFVVEGVIKELVYSEGQYIDVLRLGLLKNQDKKA